MPDVVSDRYELESRIGHGGMATVHRARDRRLGRMVAVKVLADNLAGDDEIRKRFMREARLAAKLEHPNVVQVFDVGEDDGRPYIVMEYLDGGTLDDQLQRRTGLPQDKALPAALTDVRGPRSRASEAARAPRHQAAEPAAAEVRRLPEDRRLRDRASGGGDDPADAGRAR